MPRSESQLPPGPNEPRRRPERVVKALLQHEDILIAAMAGMLAWVITLALKMAFSG